jgi:hypothetical protein
MGLKVTAIRSKFLRDAARGQQCTLQIPGVCKGRTDTTILAHLDGEEKGRGLKVDDLFGADACFECHAALDGHKLNTSERMFYECRALRRTLKRRVRQGVIKIKGYENG